LSPLVLKRSLVRIQRYRRAAKYGEKPLLFTRDLPALSEAEKNAEDN